MYTVSTYNNPPPNILYFIMVCICITVFLLQHVIVAYFLHILILLTIFLGNDQIIITLNHS